jgi:hypothetical protein
MFKQYEQAYDIHVWTMHITSMFKRFKYMNDIHEKQISHNYYCQIMTYEVYDNIQVLFYCNCNFTFVLCLHAMNASIALILSWIFFLNYKFETYCNVALLH